MGPNRLGPALIFKVSRSVSIHAMGHLGTSMQVSLYLTNRFHCNRLTCKTIRKVQNLMNASSPTLSPSSWGRYWTNDLNLDCVHTPVPGSKPKPTISYSIKAMADLLIQWYKAPKGFLVMIIFQHWCLSPVCCAWSVVHCCLTCS